MEVIGLTDTIREVTLVALSRELGKTIEETELMYRELPKKYPHPYHGFMSLGFQPERYMYEVFNSIDPTQYLRINARLKEKLDSHEGDKFVVTLAAEDYANLVLSAIGITDCFQDVVSAIRHPPSYAKIVAYEAIRNGLKLHPSDIKVIGNNYVNDLKDADELGYEVLHVKGPDDFSHKNLL